MNYKKSIEEALLRHHKRDSKGRLKKTKYGKPEKLTEKECLDWMRSKGWSVDIVEGKGGIGMYGQVTVKAGFPDCCGVTNIGQACFIEFKAKNRQNTIRPAQYKFLTEKIQTGAFAACVDSVDRLRSIYQGWMKMVGNFGLEAGKGYLTSSLPSNKKIKEMFNDDDDDLF